MRFHALRNRDAATAYIDALLSVGHVLANGFADADFLLYDYERGSGGKRDEMQKFLAEKPGFVYPHTPLSWFIWDGAYSPLPVRCNFVAGEAAVRGMKIYGYPYRVEACGFPRCKVEEFQPTKGSRVLFVPARTRRDGGYASEEYKAKTPQAFRFLLDHAKEFEKVTVCYAHSFGAVGISDWVGEAMKKGFELIFTDPYKDKDPMHSMIERIGAADLVISCETVGCVSVAMGKPTVFYNSKAIPETLAGRAKHPEAYKDYAFPLTVEEMKIGDILAVRNEKNEAVENWKRLNIGGNFEAEKFVGIVEELL